MTEDSFLIPKASFDLAVYSDSKEQTLSELLLNLQETIWAITANYDQMPLFFLSVKLEYT